MATQEDLEQRISQIDGWIRALTNEAHFLDQRVHLLKPLIHDAEVKNAMMAKLDQTPGVRLWNQLVPLLGQDYIRELARLFLDRGDKTGSLTNIWRKLQIRGVRDHYRDSYGRMFDYLHCKQIEGVSEAAREQGRQQERERNLVIFDEEWARLTGSMVELSDHPVAISVRTFRDKRHAHWEMQPISQEPLPFDISKLDLTYNGIFEFGRMCEKILADLGKLLTHTHWEPSEFTEMSAEEGRALWITLAS